MLHECAPNPLTHARGIHPNVLQRPPSVSILEGAHPNQPVGVLRYQDTVLDQIAGLDGELRMPRGEPLDGIVPVSLGSLGELAELRSIV